MSKTSVFASIVLFGIVLLASCKDFQDGYDKGYTEAYLKDIAAQQNKKYPMMLNEDIRIDSISVKPDRTLLYNYTLVNYLKADIDTVILKREFKKVVKTGLDTSKAIDVVRGKQVNFGYLYRDKNKEYVFSFVMKPKSSKKKRSQQYNSTTIFYTVLFTRTKGQN